MNDDQKPVYERGLGAEGQHPPVANAKELRALLNDAWRVTNGSDTGHASLAIAELLFRQTILDDEMRTGRLVGRSFQRDVVPVEYADAYVRSNGQAALEAGREQGRKEADKNITQGVVRLQLLLNRVHEIAFDKETNTDRIAQILQLAGSAQVDEAQAEITRIERAAYDRGEANANTRYADRAAELAAELEQIRRTVDNLDALLQERDRLLETAQNKLDEIAGIADQWPNEQRADVLIEQVQAVLER